MCLRFWLGHAAGGVTCGGGGGPWGAKFFLNLLGLPWNGVRWSRGTAKCEVLLEAVLPGYPVVVRKRLIQKESTVHRGKLRRGYHGLYV